MSVKKNKGQLFSLHGSTDMRVESRVRLGDLRVPGVVPSGGDEGTIISFEVVGRGKGGVSDLVKNRDCLAAKSTASWSGRLMCRRIQRKAHEGENEDKEWRRMSMRCTIGLGG